MVTGHRCPFVAAVAAGDLEQARRVAQAGDDPAEEVVIPVLIRWAQAVADGELLEGGAMH